MSEIGGFSEIFEALVITHSSRPRNFSKLLEFDTEAEGVNPLTGDQLLIQFRIEVGEIAEVVFSGKGSALAIASASVLTCQLEKLSTEQAIERITQVLQWINLKDCEPPSDLPDDEFSVFLEIRQIPHRRRCASLAWNTALSALEKLHLS